MLRGRRDHEKEIVSFIVSRISLVIGWSMVGILFVRLSNGIGNLLFKLIEVIYYGLS